MAVNQLMLQSGETEAPTTGAARFLRRARFDTCCLTVAIALGGLISGVMSAPAHAQTIGRLDPKDCLQPGEPMLWVPELTSQGGKLTGTIMLGDQLRRLGTSTECAEQYLRYFEGVNAKPPPMPPGAGAATPGPAPRYVDPLPGPTLRARVGDIVQLTFLNQVNTLHYGASLDRGDDAGACDQFSPGTETIPGFPPGKGYPENAQDTFPNCFHGSSTANIHFHGTHTNPNSTGDNVLLFVRPSPRTGGQPVVTGAGVGPSFREFFNACETQLKADILSEWPKLWSDLPQTWRDEQETLLKAYDAGKPQAQQLWPQNQQAIQEQRWPQYYVGAYPYCFRLPEYTAVAYPPPPSHPLKMGQAPGLHWYHAHKHGSTALNVSNGMTGAFIIEGDYDQELNRFYGKVGDDPWTRTQPVLVVNQLGGQPNLARNVQLGSAPFSINGRIQPTMTIRPGEVQLWRIVNTSSRSFMFFTGLYTQPSSGGPATKAPFEWKQLAQDGVQFADINYQNSLNVPILLAPGNRADILVKAPMVSTTTTYDINVQSVVARSRINPTAAGKPLFSVKVTGTPPANPAQTQFIRKAPKLPPFLEDIKDNDVKYSRTITFDTKKKGEAHQHTVDGEQFHENKIGARVYLNTVEEWKVVNRTNSSTSEGVIDHPFHIHINPFQIVEVFDPNEKLVDAKGTPLVDPKTGKPAVDGSGKPLDKYVFGPPSFPDLQCQLNINNPLKWNDCHNTPIQNGVWWDVFPIPSGRVPKDNNGKDVTDAKGDPIVIPGYFKMRSRFVDYPGLYVLHCHILAHEDRGMMTIVEVKVPEQRTVKHH